MGRLRLATPWPAPAQGPHQAGQTQRRPLHSPQQTSSLHAAQLSRGIFSGSSQRTCASFENRWVWSGRQRRTLAQGAIAWRYPRVHRIRDIAVGLPIPRQDRRAGQRPGVREAQAPQTVATTTAAHAHNMTGGLRRCAKATRSTATGTRAEAARSTGTGARAEAGLLWQRAAVATCAVQRWGVQRRAAVATAVERSDGSGQSVQPRAAVATGVGRSCGGPI